MLSIDLYVGPYVTAELLANGANARLLSAEGDSCLNIAVQYNRHGAVDLLIDAKLDVTLKNSAGKTCFHTARGACVTLVHSHFSALDLRQIQGP